MDQVFVVGTGRCGSTLISSMLRLHPDLVSLSEFFSFVTDLGCRIPASFPTGDVTGPAFWTLVASSWPRQNLMIRHDVAMEEVIYPFHDPTRRFSGKNGIPALAQVTLPHLSPDPDALFAEAEAFATALDPAPISLQYQRFFAWFAQREGKDCWVERSGGGLRILARLLEHFPQARFVHVVRDGRNAALSMSQHRGFRMALAAIQLMESLGVDPFESSDRRWEEDLPDDLAALLPERFTREAFLAFETPAPLCGHYWSGEIKEGLKILENLEAQRLLTLRYEDFLDQPRDTCQRLMAFIRPGPVDPTWLEQASALVGKGRSAWQSLDPKARAQLELACRPGLDALAAAGFTWPQPLP